MAKKLKGTDIINTINIDIHSPVLPNRDTLQAFDDKVTEVLGQECNLKFHTERGNAFEMSVYNGDLQEKPEIQEKVMKLFFTFLYQNH